MLIQPFIENAIVHGLSPKNRDMFITLKINKTNEYLSCTLEDNGIGRKKAMEISEKRSSGHKSAGIDIAKQSILLRFKKNRIINDYFEIVDNYDVNKNAIGTTVLLKIPYKTLN